MRYKTENDIKLSSYFSNMLVKSLKVPPLKKISKETSISISTISRFAKRNGYFNFPELRRSMNKSLDSNQNNIINKLKDGLKNIVLEKKTDKIIIYSSSFTYVVAHLIFQRLQEITKKKIEIRQNNDFENTKNSSYIFTTISGLWSAYEIFENNNKLKNNSLLISSNKPKIISKKSLEISLDGFITTNRAQEFKLVSKMFNDVSDALISLYIDLVLNVKK